MQFHETVHMIRQSANPFVHRRESCIYLFLEMIEPQMDQPKPRVRLLSETSELGSNSAHSRIGNPQSPVNALETLANKPFQISKLWILRLGFFRGFFRHMLFQLIT